MILAILGKLEIIILTIIRNRRIKVKYNQQGNIKNIYRSKNMYRMMRIYAVMMYLEKIILKCRIKVEIKQRNKKREKFMEK